MIKSKAFRFFLLSIAASSIMVACKKDKDPDNSKESKMKFNWKITSITTPKAGQPTTDSSIYKACLSDDLIKFTNTAFDFEDGTTRCDSTIFNYAKGTWKYKTAGDSIQLFATSPAKYNSWKVLVLNDSVLQVRYTDSIVPTKKISKTINFKH